MPSSLLTWSPHHPTVHLPILPLGFILHNMGSLPVMPSPVNQNLYRTCSFGLSHVSTQDEVLKQLESGHYVINNSLLSQPNGGKCGMLQSSKLINCSAVVVAIQHELQTTNEDFKLQKRNEI